MFLSAMYAYTRAYVRMRGYATTCNYARGALRVTSRKKVRIRTLAYIRAYGGAQERKEVNGLWRNHTLPRNKYTRASARLHLKSSAVFYTGQATLSGLIVLCYNVVIAAVPFYRMFQPRQIFARYNSY